MVIDLFLLFLILQHMQWLHRSICLKNVGTMGRETSMFVPKITYLYTNVPC
jgi:hypothetical protein